MTFAAQLVLVTEQVVGCLRDLLGGASNRTPLELLEVKLGLLALAETLTFLHGSARLAHCGLSPQVGRARTCTQRHAVARDVTSNVVSVSSSSAHSDGEVVN